MLLEWPPARSVGFDEPLDVVCDLGTFQAAALQRVRPEEELVSALLVGYARVSTHDQDLTAQRDALVVLGVRAERTYVDHALTGTNANRTARGYVPESRKAAPSLGVPGTARCSAGLPRMDAAMQRRSARLQVSSPRCR